MTKDEALKLALRALERLACLGNGVMRGNSIGNQIAIDALTAIKEALAQPEQEPVAFEKTVCPFCTSEWVTAEQHDRNVDRVERKPLTDKDIASIFKAQRMVYNTDGVPFARAIEAAHGIKGEA